MRRGAVHALVMWVVAPPLLWLSVVRPHDESKERAARLPKQAGRYVADQEIEITDTMRQLLGTEDAAWWRYDPPDGGSPVFVVGVFHSANWKALHPPHTCLLGSHMEIVHDDLIEIPADPGVAGGATIECGRLWMRSLDRGGRPYLCLFAYLAPPDLETGNYWRFVWHQAPRAILREDVSGALLRVETWVSDGDKAAAEARCREVLRALVPAAEALLR